MPKFPYSQFQIEDVVKAEKYPRDWEPVTFKKVTRSEKSRTADIQLERSDLKTDRLRWTLAGELDTTTTYRSALLLEDTKIRGVDYHAIARSRMYKEVIPKGWHQDIIDPNLEQSHKNYQRREALSDFEPYHLDDFLSKVAKLWNIQLPETNKHLI